jgi:hypothetical protein
VLRNVLSLVTISFKRETVILSYSDLRIL